MQRDIAPVRRARPYRASHAPPPEPQTETHTRDAPPRQHAVVHCKCASRVISAAMHSLCASCASFTRSADLAAYRVTSTRPFSRRLKLNKSFSRARHVDVQRVVDGEVDLRRTSTSELACDAGTSGTLSAGDLSWCCKLAHLLFSWCAAESLRELQILRPLYLSWSCSATFEFSARK
jgi:hypothetical protein